MKNYLFFAFIVFLFSCKKDINESNNLATTPPPYTVESGYLVFRSNDDFVSTMILLSQMSVEERKNWEQNIKFKSLSSYFNDFEQKLQEADDSKSWDMLKKAKTEYQSSLYWESDTSYTINSPSSLIANISDKNGIYKIANTYFVNTINGSSEFKDVSYEDALRQKSSLNISKKASGILTNLGELPCGKPGNNSYLMNSLLWQVASTSKGKFFIKLRLYNIHSTSLGYRSFATVEYYARHKGFLGIWGGVKAQVIGIDRALRLTYSNNTNVGITYNLSTGWQPATGNSENIILISEKLKNQGLSGHPLSSFASKFSSAAKTVNDDNISSAGGNWSKIETGVNVVIPLPYPQYLLIQAVSASTSIFSPDIITYQIPLNTMQGAG